MEAGGLEITEESQDAYRGTNIGMEYFDLDICRLRYFGGTSNHWGGWSRALEAVDFKERDWVPLSGWPIEQLDLDPYRAEADAILDLPSATEAPNLPVRQTAYDFERFQFRFSPPTRFAEKYQAEIEASQEISCFLNANLVDLRLTTTHGAVTDAVFRTYDPAAEPFTVKARAYALCTGGIENARLLLNFTARPPTASATAPAGSAAASPTTRTSSSPNASSASSSASASSTSRPSSSWRSTAA